MRTFYQAVGSDQSVEAQVQPPYIECRARVAVYDAPGAAPRLVEIGPLAVGEFIESLASRVYEVASSAGGSIPYTVIREVSENLIHADFSEPVVSILDGGNTIRFADQGPGIRDKERAILPGFTTARGDMKLFIRGVGSGLPLVNDFLKFSGGHLLIEDNLGSGAVITISCVKPELPQPLGEIRPHRTVSTLPVQPGSQPQDRLFSQTPNRALLTTRQKQVLAIVLESGSAGPSSVSRELGVALSTAYRDLALLEEAGLISSESGKRTVTEAGARYLDELMSAL